MSLKDLADEWFSDSRAPWTRYTHYTITEHRKITGEIEAPHVFNYKKTSVEIPISPELLNDRNPSISDLFRQQVWEAELDYRYGPKPTVRWPTAEEAPWMHPDLAWADFDWLILDPNDEGGYLTIEQLQQAIDAAYSEGYEDAY